MQETGCWVGQARGQRLFSPVSGRPQALPCTWGAPGDLGLAGSEPGQWGAGLGQRGLVAGETVEPEALGLPFAHESPGVPGYSRSQLVAVPGRGSSFLTLLVSPERSLFPSLMENLRPAALTKKGKHARLSCC